MGSRAESGSAGPGKFEGGGFGRGGKNRREARFQWSLGSEQYCELGFVNARFAADGRATGVHSGYGSVGGAGAGAGLDRMDSAGAGSGGR